MSISNDKRFKIYPCQDMDQRIPKRRGRKRKIDKLLEEAAAYNAAMAAAVQSGSASASSHLHAPPTSMPVLSPQVSLASSSAAKATTPPTSESCMYLEIRLNYLQRCKNNKILHTAMVVICQLFTFKLKSTEVWYRWLTLIMISQKDHLSFLRSHNECSRSGWWSYMKPARQLGH